MNITLNHCLANYQHKLYRISASNALYYIHIHFLSKMLLPDKRKHWERISINISKREGWVFQIIQPLSDQHWVWLREWIPKINKRTVLKYFLGRRRNKNPKYNYSQVKGTVLLNSQLTLKKQQFNTQPFKQLTYQFTNQRSHHKGTA